MFDEAPPSSNTATPSGPQTGSVGGPTETASGPSVVSQPSGSGQGSRNSRGRMKMKKSSNSGTKNGSKNSEQNGGSGNGHSKQPLENLEDSDSSDLEDALGSPNESTAALGKNFVFLNFSLNFSLRFFLS